MSQEQQLTIQDAVKNQQQQLIIEDAVNIYGTQAQINMATEECAELIHAICKLRRNTTVKNLENLYEEIADVEIMLAQLKYIFGCHADVRKNIDAKLERLHQRMANKK